MDPTKQPDAPGRDISANNEAPGQSISAFLIKFHQQQQKDVTLAYNSYDNQNDSEILNALEVQKETIANFLTSVKSLNKTPDQINFRVEIDIDEIKIRDEDVVINTMEHYFKKDNVICLDNDNIATPKIKIEKCAYCFMKLDTETDHCYVMDCCKKTRAMHYECEQRNVKNLNDTLVAEEKKGTKYDIVIYSAALTRMEHCDYCGKQKSYTQYNDRQLQKKKREEVTIELQPSKQKRCPHIWHKGKNAGKCCGALVYGNFKHCPKHRKLTCHERDQ